MMFAAAFRGGGLLRRRYLSLGGFQRAPEIKPRGKIRIPEETEGKYHPKAAKNPADPRRRPAQQHDQARGQRNTSRRPAHDRGGRDHVVILFITPPLCNYNAAPFLESEFDHNSFLLFGAWNFSGAWNLDFGAF
jgi:hypothetical protein